MTNKAFISAALTFALLCGFANAQENRPISKVRQAAIDKMQSKLGTMRGSIKPKQHNIFLTSTMIEMLKPIRPGQQPAQAVESTPTEITTFVKDADAPPVLPTPDRKTKVSKADRIDRENPEYYERYEEGPVNDGQIFEDLGPVQLPPNTVTVERETDVPLVQADLPTSARPNETRSQRLHREIFKAVRDPLTTNSIKLEATDVGRSLPNTSDMDVLLKAVDAMVENQN